MDVVRTQIIVSMAKTEMLCVPVRTKEVAPTIEVFTDFRIQVVSENNNTNKCVIGYTGNIITPELIVQMTHVALS